MTNRTNLVWGHYSFAKNSIYQEGEYMATVGPEGSLRIWNAMNGFQLHAVYYGPVNRMGFIKDSPIGLVVGEATGNMKHLRVLPKGTSQQRAHLADVMEI